MLEEKKISEIYHSFSRELFSYLVRLVSDRENAEDLLHDTFAALIAYSKNHAIEDSSVRAFLYKTAHNLAVNFIKKQSWRPFRGLVLLRMKTPHSCSRLRFIESLIHSMQLTALSLS